MKKVRWVGLDVHADSIAVAVAEPTGEVRPLGQIPNRPESIRSSERRFLTHLGMNLRLDEKTVRKVLEVIAIKNGI